MILEDAGQLLFVYSLQVSRPLCLHGIEGGPGSRQVVPFREELVSGARPCLGDTEAKELELTRGRDMREQVDTFLEPLVAFGSGLFFQKRVERR